MKVLLRRAALVAIGSLFCTSLVHADPDKYGVETSAYGRESMLVWTDAHNDYELPLREGAGVDGSNLGAWALARHGAPTASCRELVHSCKPALSSATTRAEFLEKVAMLRAQADERFAMKREDSPLRDMSALTKKLGALGDERFSQVASWLPPVETPPSDLVAAMNGVSEPSENGPQYVLRRNATLQDVIDAIVTGRSSLLLISPDSIDISERVAAVTPKGSLQRLAFSLFFKSALEKFCPASVPNLAYVAPVGFLRDGEEVYIFFRASDGTIGKLEAGALQKQWSSIRHEQEHQTTAGIYDLFGIASHLMIERVPDSPRAPLRGATRVFGTATENARSAPQTD